MLDSGNCGIEFLGARRRDTDEAGVTEHAVAGGRLLRFEVRGATVDGEGNVGDDILVWTPVVLAP